MGNEFIRINPGLPSFQDSPSDMNPLIIESWIDEIEVLSDSLQETHGIQTLETMSSPSKRSRPNEYRDPDETPTRIRPQASRYDDPSRVFEDAAMNSTFSTRSTSSFSAVLASRAAFSAPTPDNATPTETSYFTTRSRSTSPTKRFHKAVTLLSLERPVRFTKERDLGGVLPKDAKDVFEALSAIEAKEEILPSPFRGHPDFCDSRIRPFMWKSASISDQDVLHNGTALLSKHGQLRTIIDASITSSNLHRSEAAWNCLVHTPFLIHATASFSFLGVEPIASAQIMPAFRPRTKSSGPVLSSTSDELSSASSASEHNSGATQPRSRPTVSSVHKMVDFAVVLHPGQELQRLIDNFVEKQPHTTATINQTIYEPLRIRPAPIFIETKTSAGTMDAANVQLGVWVAAWYERMRILIALGGGADKIITMPVIQIVGSVWTLLFVADEGTEIRVLDGNMRIGDTDSIVGIYQLQAAVSALAHWVKDTFEPWFTALLARTNST